jgi:hypothetical protein
MSDDTIQSPPQGAVGTTPQRPRVKYQVFVSSTYRDLHKERERVVWAVLEARQIPVGMENFTASDERGWRTITRVIDDTDYYVLILAGLYGSVDQATGISWTQREYEYATSKGIPVLAFIREQEFIPGNNVETDPESRRKLLDFIGKVKANHLYKPWKTTDDLSASVASALRNTIQDDADDGKARPGWIRGDSLPSMESFEELARLSAENARLRVALEAAQATTPQRSNLSLVRETTNQPAEESVELDHSLIVLAKLPANLDAHLQELNALRNQTVWFNLAVKNSGAVAARGVVVDCRFPDAKTIHLHLDQYAHPEEEANFFAAAKNPANHCYVDSISRKKIRQRIKLIAPGGTEPLVRFGVEVPTDAAVGMEYVLTGDFSALAEDGASSSGQFVITVRWPKAEKKKTIPHLMKR